MEIQCDLCGEIMSSAQGADGYVCICINDECAINITKLSSKSSKSNIPEFVFRETGIPRLRRVVWLSDNLRPILKKNTNDIAYETVWWKKSDYCLISLEEIEQDFRDKEAKLKIWKINQNKDKLSLPMINDLLMIVFSKEISEEVRIKAADVIIDRVILAEKQKGAKDKILNDKIVEDFIKAELKSKLLLQIIEEQLKKGQLDFCSQCEAILEKGTECFYCGQNI